MCWEFEETAENSNRLMHITMNSNPIVNHTIGFYQSQKSAICNNQHIVLEQAFNKNENGEPMENVKKNIHEKKVLIKLYVKFIVF